MSESVVEKVQDFFRESGALDYARDSMNSCFARAERKISRMKLPDDDKLLLRGFIGYCRGRRK